jgi:hypothetical protein
MRHFWQVLDPFKVLLGFASMHFEGVPAELVAEGVALQRMILFVDVTTLRRMLDVAKRLVLHFSHQMSQELGRAWKQHVWQNLLKGGGTLYKYISMWDKKSLNVDWSISKGDNSSPNAFLSSQVKKWKLKWAPDSNNTHGDIQHKRVCENLLEIREHALSFPPPQKSP